MVTEFSWQLAAAGLLEFSTAPMFTAAELVRTRAELVDTAAFLTFTDVELVEFRVFLLGHRRRAGANRVFLL